MKQFHFITGLPRSGTTLLTAILNQNPNFSASISGPLARFTGSIIEHSSDQGGYRFQCPVEKRKEIIKSIFHTYHPEDKIHFDTSRAWTLLLPLLKDLFPSAKVVCCVRDIPWILDSFENLVRKNPYENSNIFQGQENLNVYTRCETLMRPDRTVGFAYNALKQAITSKERNMLHLVEYERLAKNPYETVKGIYDFIGLEHFQHDFDSVESSFDEFDADVGLSGLHTTRKKVEFIKREMIIPPDIQQHFSGMEVWRQ